MSFHDYCTAMNVSDWFWDARVCSRPEHHADELTFHLTDGEDTECSVVSLCHQVLTAQFVFSEWPESTPPGESVKLRKLMGNE